VVRHPRSARTTGVAAQQIGHHATFIEEQVLTRIMQRLPVAPGAPLSGDVGASLFVGVYRFF
jgi:hypothetical protein